MLNKEDREEIAKLIAQNLVSQQNQQKKEDPYKGASKKEREKLAKQDAIYQRMFYLDKLRYQGKDTLAQRLELEKLKILDKTPNLLKDTAKGAGKVVKTGAHIAGSVADAASSTIKSAANSKLSQDLLKSVMYSNPITALIAENSGLLKGLGKGVLSVGKLGLQATGAVASGAGKLLGWGANKLYQKFRKGKGSDNSSVGNMLEQKEKMNSFGGTNYISAQKATFIGGTNNIYLGGMSGASGMFQQKGLLETTKDKIGGFIGTAKDKMSGFLGMNKTAGLIGAANIPLLPGPKKKDDDVIEMTKGIDGIYKEAKKSNKFLEILGKKQLLIVGGIMLAVGAIFALAKGMQLLANKMIEPSTPTTPNNISLTNFKDQTNTSPDDYKNNMQKAINQEAHIAKWDEFSKKVKIPGKRKSINSFIHAGYVAESTEGSVYRAPFNMKIIKWKVNNKKLGVINIIAEKIIPKGINKNIELMNIVEPVVVPGQTVNKGEPIGKVGPTGKIHIKDISREDMLNYINMINSYADDNNKQGFNMTEQQAARLNKTMQYFIKKGEKTKNTEFELSDSDLSAMERQELSEQKRQKEKEQHDNYVKSVSPKINPFNDTTTNKEFKQNVSNATDPFATKEQQNQAIKNIQKAKDNQQQIKQNQKQENINGEKSSYNTNQPTNTTIALGSSSNDSSVFTPSIVERTNMYPDTMSLYSTFG